MFVLINTLANDVQNSLLFMIIIIHINGVVSFLILIIIGTSVKVQWKCLRSARELVLVCSLLDE